MTFILDLRVSDPNGVDSRWFFPGSFVHQTGAADFDQHTYEYSLDVEGSGPYIGVNVTADSYMDSYGIFDFNATDATKITLQSLAFQNGKAVVTGTLGNMNIELGTVGDGAFIYTFAMLTPDALLNYYAAAGDVHLDMQGYTGDDRLYGSNFDDFMNGQNGNDLLTGYAGSDDFVFDAWGPANFDHVADFEHGVDKAVIDKTWFVAVEADKGRQQFHDITKGGLRLEQADDRLLYNRNSGTLYYDPDGSKAHGEKPEIIAVFDNHVRLTLADVDLNMF